MVIEKREWIIHSRWDPLFSRNRFGWSVTTT